ncbi:MAG: hypothetical protein HYY20_13605 [Candidatus Tectomicrobia bacterium]|uniref:Uncharacterized protein n=1 Tax=Tectimicrobiota bacterium TaxID=2528274 RepID=A0A932CRE0_UNCTE|nr:hypothetical protein [Candidatus Tectomicrobia bacterium]
MPQKDPALFDQLKQTIAAFLERVGYQVTLDRRILFSEIAVHGQRGTHQVICQPATDIYEAVESCKDLCTAKCKLAEESDYALVFPPIKEHHFIEFLTELGGRPYYLDIRSQYLMIWIANPLTGSVEGMLGGSRDQALEKALMKVNQALKAYFYGGFTQYINRIIDEKMRKGEL